MSHKLIPLMPNHWLPHSVSQEPMVSPIDNSLVEDIAYRQPSKNPSRIQRDKSCSGDASARAHWHRRINVVTPPEQVDYPQKLKSPIVTANTVYGHGDKNDSTRSVSYWIERLWLFEVLAEVTAALSLALMFAILCYFNGRRQTDWQSATITLNGVVSFLATVARAALMVPVSAAIGQRKWLWFIPSSKRNGRGRRLRDFETFDDASRGSLGSFRLFKTVKMWDIVCIGALITILSVFFEAVTQNVLSTILVTEDGSSQGFTAARRKANYHSFRKLHC